MLWRIVWSQACNWKHLFCIVPAGNCNIFSICLEGQCLLNWTDAYRWQPGNKQQKKIDSLSWNPQNFERLFEREKCLFQMITCRPHAGTKFGWDHNPRSHNFATNATKLGFFHFLLFPFQQCLSLCSELGQDSKNRAFARSDQIEHKRFFGQLWPASFPTVRQWQQGKQEQWGRVGGFHNNNNIKDGDGCFWLPSPHYICQSVLTGDPP